MPCSCLASMMSAVLETACCCQARAYAPARRRLSDSEADSSATSATSSSVASSSTSATVRRMLSADAADSTTLPPSDADASSSRVLLAAAPENMYLRRRRSSGGSSRTQQREQRGQRRALGCCRRLVPAAQLSPHGDSRSHHKQAQHWHPWRGLQAGATRPHCWCRAKVWHLLLGALSRRRARPEEWFKHPDCTDAAALTSGLRAAGGNGCAAGDACETKNGRVRSAFQLAAVWTRNEAVDAESCGPAAGGTVAWCVRARGHERCSNATRAG